MSSCRATNANGDDVSLRVSYSIDGIGHVLDGVVAAALVAVADALRNAYDVDAVAEWIDVEGDGPKAALDTLAAALGVSR